MKMTPKNLLYALFSFPPLRLHTHTQTHTWNFKLLPMSEFIIHYSLYGATLSAIINRLVFILGFFGEKSDQNNNSIDLCIFILINQRESVIWLFLTTSTNSFRLVQGTIDGKRGRETDRQKKKKQFDIANKSMMRISSVELIDNHAFG